jgi:hypothetical protein
MASTGWHLGKDFLVSALANKIAAKLLADLKIGKLNQIGIDEIDAEINGRHVVDTYDGMKRLSEDVCRAVVEKTMERADVALAPIIEPIDNVGIQKIRDHIKAHRRSGRAIFSIAGIEGLLARLETAEAEIRTERARQGTLP